MKRRQAIHTSSWILKSALFGPGLVTAIQGCTDRIHKAEDLLVFDDELMQLVKKIADSILPRTESPSASEVKVPQVMDLLLHDVYEDEDKDHFIDGLAKFDRTCKAKMGKSFIALNQEESQTYLTKIDRVEMEKSYDDEISFYHAFKALCISIYFLTEEGIKQNLSYNPIPGGFEGDVALGSDQKIEVGNEM